MALSAWPPLLPVVFPHCEVPCCCDICCCVKKINVFCVMQLSQLQLLLLLLLLLLLRQSPQAGHALCPCCCFMRAGRGVAGAGVSSQLGSQARSRSLSPPHSCRGCNRWACRSWASQRGYHSAPVRELVVHQSIQSLLFSRTCVHSRSGLVCVVPVWLVVYCVALVFLDLCGHAQGLALCALRAHEGCVYVCVFVCV
jgi:hypothetical protein